MPYLPSSSPKQLSRIYRAYYAPCGAQAQSTWTRSFIDSDRRWKWALHIFSLLYFITYRTILGNSSPLTIALFTRELLSSVLAQAGFVGDQAITMREKTSKAQHQDWDFGFCTNNIPLSPSALVYFVLYSTCDFGFWSRIIPFGSWVLPHFALHCRTGSMLCAEKEMGNASSP